MSPGDNPTARQELQSAQDADTVGLQLQCNAIETYFFIAVVCGQFFWNCSGTAL